MIFHILTIFPEIFSSFVETGILKKAIEKNKIAIHRHDIRDFSDDKNKNVDDYSFGGGSGMIMKPDPIFKGVESIKNNFSEIDSNDVPVILLSPQGKKLDQKLVEELSQKESLILICGRYGGVDHRVNKYLATEEISVGDFILSGGEVAAMSIIESVSRLIDGVVGSKESVEKDSFTSGLLQHPQYTRPSKFREWEVPSKLLSGNHKEILKWQRRESILKTFLQRPDLIDYISLTPDDQKIIDSIKSNRDQPNNPI